MRTAALIVAAGRGSRVGADVPKQYLRLGATSVLHQAVAAFAGHAAVDRVQVVIHPDDRDLYARSLAIEDLSSGRGKLAPPVPGGASRQTSVRLGLEALAPVAPDAVLIHDAARPFVPADVIARVLAALAGYPGAIPALPVADTLKRAADDGTVAATVARKGLWRAQTPQGFRFADILTAHRRAASAGLDDLTDDAAVAEWAGLAVALVEGAPENVKITSPADVAAARSSLEAETGRTDRNPSEARMIYEPRIGTGFDVHRFAAGSSLWLCGVEIPHTHRLEGHSDADVGLHALTDALLGAIGDGDIGQHFPPTDPRWMGAASDRFLADAARRVGAIGGRIMNVDVTILCEAPRIGPHRQAMQKRVADILGIAPGRVGIKATTTEQLGFTGRREGIAAMASALVLLPFSPAPEQT